MSKRDVIVLSDKIEVEIQDENYKKIGEAPSLAKAARMCFIRNPSSIWDHLFRGNKLREKRAITSKVTGKQYRFKLKEY